MRALVALSVLLGGCASILGLEDGTEITADAGFEPPVLPDAPLVMIEIFVSPAGDDANDGSITSPFATISHAVTVAAPGATIRLAPGTYNQLSGESFPIVVSQERVEIAGPANTGQAVIVGDPGVFEIGDGFLHDVELSSSCGIGVIVSAGGRVERCTISAPIAEGIFSASLDVALRENQISGSAAGIRIDDPGSTGDLGAVADNVVVQNTIGIDIQTATDVSLGSNNEFSCNTNADLRMAGASLDASNTIWDHDPPEEGNLGGGIDITTVGASSVTANNPILSSNPCP